MSAAAGAVTSLSSCGERIKAKSSRETKEKHQKPVTLNPIFTLIKARGSISGLTPGSLNPAGAWAPRCAQRPPRHGLRGLCRVPGLAPANGTIYRSQVAAPPPPAERKEKKTCRELDGRVLTPGWEDGSRCGLVSALGAVVPARLNYSK